MLKLTCADRMLTKIRIYAGILRGNDVEYGFIRAKHVQQSVYVV